MTAAALVESLRSRGVQIRAVDGRIRYRPASAVTQDELEALRQHKADVLRLLAPEPPWP
jgi:nonribosomal peptide synthetase DhbF